MTDILYFDGYRTPEPGDFITAYRHETCIGWISWLLNGEIIWTLGLGQSHTRCHDAASVAEAKQQLANAFNDWCSRHGLRVEGPSAAPAAAHTNSPEYILSVAKHFTSSAEVEAYMKRRDIRRRLAEMVEYDRQRVRHEVNDHRLNLLKQEMGEPEPAP